MATIRACGKSATPQAELWRKKKTREHWRLEVLRRSHIALRVGFVLRDYMNCARGGYAWLRRKKLGERALVPKLSNVSRALTELENAGLITRYVYGPELAQVFTVRLDRKSYQTVYTLHLPGDSCDIREWHEKRGIPRRSESSPCKAKRRVKKAPRKPFEVISFPGSVKESPQSG
jgi:hypothetical protein